MIRAIANLFFSRRLARQTSRYLHEIASAPIHASREKATNVIKELAFSPEPKITVGRTEWGQELAPSVSDLVNGHSLCLGSTGAGKTRFMLGIVKALIENSRPFGVIDAKGELYTGTLTLIAERLCHLRSTDIRAAEALQNQVVALDFSSKHHPISPYNLLVPWPNAEPGFFAESRADLILGLLAQGDAISLSGTALLQRGIMLLATARLPVTSIIDVLHDDSFRARLVNQCANRDSGNTSSGSSPARRSRRSWRFRGESIRYFPPNPSAVAIRPDRTRFCCTAGFRPYHCH